MRRMLSFLPFLALSSAFVRNYTRTPENAPVAGGKRDKTRNGYKAYKSRRRQSEMQKLSRKKNQK